MITFTAKKWRIIRLVAEGYSNPQIAKEVGNTRQVIENYLKQIYDKTGMDGRLELALWYWNNFGSR